MIMDTQLASLFTAGALIVIGIFAFLTICGFIVTFMSELDSK